jgi:hypothetical protein
MQLDKMTIANTAIVARRDIGISEQEGAFGVILTRRALGENTL